MHELVQEVEYCVDLWEGDRLDFDPLGKLVDGHQNSVESSWRSRERPNHVEPPAGERLGWWYSDYLVGRDVLLLGEVLASLAPYDEFLGITQSCGPVESSSESFADQCAKRCVVATDAFVDLLQDVLAFFSGNTLHEYSRSGTPYVELVFD
jgi:hypothetical protein